MNIAIIEDEILTANDLAATIKQAEPNVKNIQILQSVEEGRIFFEGKHSIDLIFSDIELGDGLSFEIFEKANINIPIIFCTAYNEYALRAFETAGIYYILKPFGRESIAKALEKFYLIYGKNDQKKIDYDSVFSKIKKKLLPSQMPTILINQGEKIIPVSGSDIAIFSIEYGTVKAYTFTNDYYIVRETLEELQLQFSDFYFRANRQYLINKQAVEKATQYTNRKLLVIFKFPFANDVIVGKEKVRSFLKWLASI